MHWAVCVISGVSQGSVLGTILFVISTNEIQVGICGNVLMFSDETRLFCKVGFEENYKIKG